MLVSHVALPALAPLWPPSEVFEGIFVGRVNESSCFGFLSITDAQAGGIENEDAVKKSGLVLCGLLLLSEVWKVGVRYVG